MRAPKKFIWDPPPPPPPYLKVWISHWVHYGSFVVLIHVKYNSPRLSPVKPFQPTRKAVVQRITKNSVRKSYLSRIVNGLKPGVISLIGRLSRDFIGRLSVKPWCYWVWRVYMWLVRSNCNLCLKCLLCGLAQKNKNWPGDANIRIWIRRRVVKFNPDLNRVLNKISYLGSCIW